MPLIFHYKRAPREITIAGKFEDGYLKLSASACMPTNTFIKKRGVQIASGRLEKGKYVAVIPVDTRSGKKFVEIAKGIAQEVSKKTSLIADGLVL